MLEIGRRLDLRWLGDATATAASNAWRDHPLLHGHFPLRLGFRRADAGMGGRGRGGDHGLGAGGCPADRRGIERAGQVTEQIILHTALSAAASFRRLCRRRRRGACGIQRRLAQCRGPSAVGCGRRLMIAWLMALRARWSRRCCRSARWHRSSSSWPRPCSPSALPACWRCRFSDAFPDGGDPVVQRSGKNAQLYQPAGRTLAAGDHPLRRRRRFAALAGLHLADRTAGDWPADRSGGGQGRLPLAWAGGGLPAVARRVLVGIGIQPLSATAVFMAYEIAGLYPEIGRSSLSLPLFAAAIMELAGPALCRFALTRAGETAATDNSKGGVA
jgi:hypothetical protein